MEGYLFHTNEIYVIRNFHHEKYQNRNKKNRDIFHVLYDDVFQDTWTSVTFRRFHSKQLMLEYINVQKIRYSVQE